MIVAAVTLFGLDPLRSYDTSEQGAPDDVVMGDKTKREGDALSLGDSVGTRTQDPQLRRLLLYPAELRNQKRVQR